MTPTIRQAFVAPLAPARKAALRGFAQWWVAAATLFSGIAIALQKPLTEAFPGTAGDRIMYVFALTSVFSVLGTLFKLPAVKWWGPALERKIGTHREVKLRHVMRRGVGSTALWGGTLQAFHSMLFVGLVAYISPAGLAAARACVIIPLAGVELYARILKPAGPVWWFRLLASLTCTLTGALIVVFAGGFDGIFKKTGALPFILLLLLLSVGNLGLAVAEYQEYKGVHHSVAAAPVYTLARFIVYAATCIVAMITWGVYNHHFDVMIGVLQMCLHRWYFVVGIALFWALTDLSRICVKTIIAATYMYIIMAFAVMIDVITQTILRAIWPEVYDNVNANLAHVIWALGGTVVVLIAMWAYPHAKEEVRST